VKNGGFGGAILEFAADHHYHIPIKVKAVADEFIEHGNLQELQHITGLDAESICNSINESLLFVSSR
jgi:1-deoxy-D-xylulose-5-phosphate synthase